MEKQESKPEIKEKEPKISYDIFYAPHRTVKDFEKLEEAFKKADVYVPEMPGWTPKTADQIKEFSQKDMSFKNFLLFQVLPQDSAMYKELQVIKGSEKPILVVDIPNEHELLREISKTFELLEKSIMLFSKGVFRKSLQSARKYIESMVKNTLKRDEFIKENLKTEVKKLIEKSPELQKKKEVRILLNLGTAHTRIYHGLKEEEKLSKGKSGISRQFAYQPTIFSSLSEAERKIAFSKNKEISDELLARGIIEALVYSHINNLSDDSVNETRICRKIVSKLDLDNMEEISEELGRDSKKTVVDALKERGIKIPESEKEMDEMIKK